MSLNKDNKNNFSNKSFHSNHNSPKIANIKIVTNYISNAKKNKIKIKDLIEKDANKDIINSNSNQGIKMLSQNNSKKKILAKETTFDLLKNKQQFKNIILRALLNNNKEKKLGKENTNVNLTKIQNLLMKNGRKINFNLTKKIFLNKSNSVKMVKHNNPDDINHYNNYIAKKKEEHVSHSPPNKNLMEIKNIINNNDFKTTLIQQYLKNKNINTNKINVLLNNEKLSNKNHQPLRTKKHRNNSQREGEEFTQKIMSLLNNKEKAKDKNSRKNELKKSKNLFLNQNTNYYNIMTLNKKKSKNFNKNINNIKSPTTNEHFSSNNNINNNIKQKTTKENETIINHFYQPRLMINNKLKKNKIFNCLSGLNINSKNENYLYKKFPFVYNLNTISNSHKNMLTINIDDSYTKNIIKGKVINIHNHNFLTSNNIRSHKNIRNIIVNNISPTVNVLIHSEGKYLSKNKKSKEQKRINSNNNRSKNIKINENFYESQTRIKSQRKQFNNSKKKQK